MVGRILGGAIAIFGKRYPIERLACGLLVKNGLRPLPVSVSALDGFASSSTMDRSTSFATPRLQDDPQISFRVRDTRDADEQAACLTGWGQRYEQMSAGAFHGRFESYRFDGIELFCERTNQVIQQFGVPQPGCMAVASIQGSDSNGYFCGLPLNLGRYLFLRGGKEFHFRTPRQCEVASVSVNAQAFDEYCERVRAVQSRGKCMDNGLLPQRLSDDLGDLLRSVLSSLRDTPDILSHPAVRHCLTESLYSTLLDLYESAETVRKDLTARCREYVVNKARDYMAEHVDAPITVSDLCAHVRVSRRTLQYAFQDVLGTTPVRYLRIMRLNGVRRDIRNRVDDQITVADIAARWGFWHLSRFASEYKSLFGELPSQTLRSTPSH